MNIGTNRTVTEVVRTPKINVADLENTEVSAFEIEMPEVLTEESVTTDEKEVVKA